MSISPRLCCLALWGVRRAGLEISDVGVGDLPTVRKSPPTEVLLPTAGLMYGALGDDGGLLDMWLGDGVLDFLQKYVLVIESVSDGTSRISFGLHLAEGLCRLPPWSWSTWG